MPRTKKIYWSPDAIKMLMKLYKEQPHLYDSKHEHYFNKDLRIEAFRQIVLEMRKIYENVLSTDIKTKICTLRSQYLSYLKKEKKNGMAKPNWVLCVEFLRPFLKPPENQKSLDCDIKPEADSDAPNCLSNDESEAGSTFDPLLTAPNDKLDIVKPKKIIWSPEAIKTLIEQYEKRPNLYDPKHDQYRNKQLRAKSLRQMVKEMRKIYETIDTTDIKNKIGTLRSQYLVHLKNEACYQKSGLETHERMAPFCVKYIEFLRPHLRFSESQRTSESDTNNTEIKPEAGTESPSSCLGQDPHHFEIHKTEIKPENVCQVEEDDDKCESDSSLESNDALNTKKTKKIRWHPESIRMLILLYESHPILYDPQHPGYRCKHDRAKSLQEIVAEMRKLYDTIDTADIKNKFSTLRSHYLSLLKIQSNWGTLDKTVPAWVEYIQFLKPFVKLPNKQTDEIKSEIDFDCSKAYESDTNSSGDPLLSSHIRATDISWRPDGIRMLIKLYERCPNLYDPNHKQYRDKVLRANSFQQILKEMRKMYERIGMADINSKIVSLRSQYLRYLKQKESNKSAPFWVAYITFLKPYLKLTSDSDDFNMPAETDTEVPCYLSDLQSGSLPSIDPLLDSLDDGLTSNKRKFKADVEAFGELIKAEMEQIENPSKRRELRMKLLKVIAEGVD